MKSILIASHIFSGVLVLLTGIAAMVSQPKGGTWHKRWGYTYYFGMLLVAFSSVLSMALYDFFFFLFPIAIFSIHLVYSGFRAIHQGRSGNITRLDWLVAWSTAIIGLALFAYGIYVLSLSNNIPLAILSLVFGFFIALSGYGDIKIYRALARQEPMWWWFHHMRGMLGSYIAAFTAFLVQNGEWLKLGDAQIILWIAPGVIGGFGIGLWSKHYKKKFEAEKSL